MLIPVTGRARSGKSSYLLHELNRLALEGKNCLFIVPEQFSFQTEKRTLKEMDSNALTKVEVISFSRIAHKLIEKYRPSHLPFVTQRGKMLLMGTALDNLWDRLTVYGNIRDKQKLVSRLLDVDILLKQGDLSSDTLFHLAEQSKDENFQNKLHDLGLLLGTYNALLSQNFSDNSSSLQQTADLLKLTDDYNGYCIAVDEFSGFTEDELAVLEQFMRKADRMYISFCYDNENSPSGNVFALPKKSRSDMITLAQKNGISIAVPVHPGEPHYANPENAHCETYLLDYSPEAFEDDAPNVTVCKCDDKAQECEYAALTAKKLIYEKGYRCKDIAVIERTQDSYASELASAFARYDLPVFRDMRRSIACEPPAAFLLAFLENVCCNFSTDAIMRFLKSDMTDFSEEEINTLDNYVLMYSIDGNEWEKEWKWHPSGLGESFNEKSRKILEGFNALREKLVNRILDFRKKIEGKNTAEITSEAYELLIENKIPEKLRVFATHLAENGETDEADTVISSWNELMDCLSDMHDVIGERYLEPKRWFELFSNIVFASTAGVAPSCLDTITIGSADRIRLTDIKAVIIVGVNEGVFPLPPALPGLFSDSERRLILEMGYQIGNDLTYVADRERFITYRAFSYASDQLFITYSKKDSSGARLLPSEIIGNLHKILPDSSFIEFSSIPSFDRITGKESAFRYLSGNFLSDAPEVTALASYFSTGEDRTRFLSLERLAEKKAPSFSDVEKVRLLYKKDMLISPTAMETYFTCPFQYFCKYGLRARPKGKAKLTAALNGTIIHYILQRIMDEVGSKELPNLSKDSLREHAEIYLNEFIQDCLPGLEEKSERIRSIIQSYIEVSVTIMTRLAAEFANSNFVTVDTELKIGPKEDIDAYRVTDSTGGSVGITGIIDRVDMLELDGKLYLRIVDYKTDGKLFRLCDIFEGLNTQMLIYLNCLWHGGKKRYGGEILPAGILYVPAETGEISLERGAADETIQKQDDKNAKMNGLLLDDPRILSAMGVHSKATFLPAYIDDEEVSHGSIASLQQFSAIHRLIDEKIKELGNGIHGGDIRPLPIIGDKHEHTCDYCSYRSVCLRESEDAARELVYIPDEQLFLLLTQEDSDNE